jgi:hypothetical protein
MNNKHLRSLSHAELQSTGSASASFFCIPYAKVSEAVKSHV